MGKEAATSQRQLEVSIVTDEHRSLSEGRLPDKDDGDLGAALLAVKKPSMEKGAATSEHQLGDAQIETESTGASPSMAS